MNCPPYLVVAHGLAYVRTILKASNISSPVCFFGGTFFFYTLFVLRESVEECRGTCLIGQTFESRVRNLDRFASVMPINIVGLMLATNKGRS